MSVSRVGSPPPHCIPPEILVNVVTFEAMQLPGVSKVATRTWMGHGFGLHRAQLLTLNPKPFHIFGLGHGQFLPGQHCGRPQPGQHCCRVLFRPARAFSP